VTFALRTFSALALSLVTLGLLGACDTATDDGSRKCFASRPATTLATATATCGTLQDFPLDICERSPSTRCTTTAPTYRCLASPGDRGILIQVSPCAAIDSLPDGWTFAETYDNGINAIFECETARTLCDGTKIPWVSPDETAGSAGSAGKGTAGNAGSGNGGNNQGGAGQNQGGAGQNQGGAGQSQGGAGGGQGGAGGGQGGAGGGQGGAGQGGAGQAGTGNAGQGGAGSGGANAGQGGAGKGGAGSGGGGAGQAGAGG
jgi:hypothetical protein